MEQHGWDGAAAAKLALRDQLRTARRRRNLLDARIAAGEIAEHLLAAPEVRRAVTVAAYVSKAHEPGTGPLLERLAEGGKRILLPVLLPDDDLDWAVHSGRLVAATRGLLEPTGPRLGVGAITTADVVLTPALAVDGGGLRLGQGGGSYDRALGRVPVGTFTCALLFDGEVLGEVPHDPHDRPVTAAATPSGVRRFRPAAG